MVIHLQYCLDQYFFLNIYSQSGNIATVLRNSANIGYLSSKGVAAVLAISIFTMKQEFDLDLEYLLVGAAINQYTNQSKSSILKRKYISYPGQLYISELLSCDYQG